VAGFKSECPADIIGICTFGLYERFRPEVPSDERGWGAKATLDVERIRNAAQDRV
jgi:hypothetical protein